MRSTIETRMYDSYPKPEEGSLENDKSGSIEQEDILTLSRDTSSVFDMSTKHEAQAKMSMI